VARYFTFEPSEIEATVGERLRIVVRSADGLHGFQIKKFKVSEEIPRGGEPVIIEFTPDELGRFPILCSVWCGDDHDDMEGALIVTARTITKEEETTVTQEEETTP
jgi:cytochrome c oxidase subunit 2